VDDFAECHASGAVSIAITPPSASVAQGVQQNSPPPAHLRQELSEHHGYRLLEFISVLSLRSVNAPGSQGLATSLAQGPTTITATSGPVTNAVTLTVLGPALVSITVTPTSPFVPLGTTQHSRPPYFHRWQQSGSHTLRHGARPRRNVARSECPRDAGVGHCRGEGSSTVTATSGSSRSTLMPVTPTGIGLHYCQPLSVSVPLVWPSNLLRRNIYRRQHAGPCPVRALECGDGTVATIVNSVPTAGWHTRCARQCDG